MSRQRPSPFDPSPQRAQTDPVQLVDGNDEAAQPASETARARMVDSDRVRSLKPTHIPSRSPGDELV
ncbi:hypothetical protein Q9R08_07360 [Microbacterium sp. QXD-8]|uniref:Uncharacterized protein n=1 Tax=Microbacterium psychrotolerans TaxID=3068321 RepID=A0ABU0Z2M1_9MICO|nr:hypothetical protein [Microbacterium sp. QXD-8]